MTGVPGSRRRVLLATAALVAVFGGVYLVVPLGGDPSVGARPVYDGAGPPPPYRWVKPPKQFARDNTPPTAGSGGDVPFAGGKSQVAAVQSPDSQFIVNLPMAAFAPHGADTKVTSKVTPLDPATLGPAPAGLRADGNGYRVELAYAPSGTPVGALAAAGNVFMLVPEAAQAILFSPDGQAWQQLDSRPVQGQLTVAAPFSRPGYYLAAASATSGTSTPLSSPAHGSRSGVAVAMVVIGAVLAVGVLVPLLWAARRRRRRA